MTKIETEDTLNYLAEMYDILEDLYLEGISCNESKVLIQNIEQSINTLFSFYCNKAEVDEKTARENKYMNISLREAFEEYKEEKRLLEDLDLEPVKNKVLRAPTSEEMGAWFKGHRICF